PPATPSTPTTPTRPAPGWRGRPTRGRSPTRPCGKGPSRRCCWPRRRPADAQSLPADPDQPGPGTQHGVHDGVVLVRGQVRHDLVVVQHRDDRYLSGGGELAQPGQGAVVVTAALAQSDP